MLDQLWLWFMELSAGRNSGFQSANPISYSDISAYFQLIGCKPEPWEVRVIKQLDAAALESSKD